MSDGLFWRDGTFPPYPPEQMKKMEHVIDTCHQNGIKVMPYFSNHELHQSTEAFKQHGEEWGRKPDDQGNLGARLLLRRAHVFQVRLEGFLQSYVDTVLKHQAIRRRCRCHLIVTYAKVLDEFGPVGGHAAGSPHGFVHRLPRRVGKVRRESHFHQNDRRFFRAKLCDERFGAGDHVRAAVRGERPADNAFLQINEDKRGLVGVESEHGGDSEREAAPL